MSYSTNNKFRIYAEDAGTENNEINGIVYTDEDWEDIAERKRGAREGVAKSQEYNTAVRQATMMSTVLAEIIVKRYGSLITTDLASSGYTNFENYVEALADKFNKINFLLDGEVNYKHLNDTVKTATYDDMTAGNVSKSINKVALGSIFESNGSTVKNATNVTTNINGKAISSIFESNGTTAKASTNVTTNINGKAISSIFESDGITSIKASTITFTTTAPTSSPPAGTLRVAVLSSEPSTKYDRVLYIIV